jgi:hypothetical protein
MNMPLNPTWTDIALRLALTMLAGAIIGLNRGARIGLNRGARGHAAGFRTTILVALAASVAMIQANILLPLGGKTQDSFSVMDLMRLPLGILTGVGFIGGGTIIKKGDPGRRGHDRSDVVAGDGDWALPGRRPIDPWHDSNRTGGDHLMDIAMGRQSHSAPAPRAPDRDVRAVLEHSGRCP